MLLAEIDQRLADLGVDESAGRGDAQPALEVGIVGAHEIGEIVDFLQDFRRGAIIGVAGFRHRELTCRAVKQKRAEFVLKLAHIFRQERLRPADAAGGGRKPFGVHDIDEGADAGERVHGRCFLRLSWSREP